MTTKRLIVVNNPEFLKAVLKDEVVARTHYLVDQGIAYDSDWRNSFVELFQVIGELETPTGDKLETPEVVEDTIEAEALDQKAYLREKAANDVTIKSHERMLKKKFPLNTQVTVGKGKTIWTVVGYSGQTVHVTREGVGKNNIYVTPNKIKFLPNPFTDNAAPIQEEEI